MDKKKALKEMIYRIADEYVISGKAIKINSYTYGFK